MSSLSERSWEIESVIVNSETMMNYEGFGKLTIEENKIIVHPIGLEFSIEEATAKSLILDSRGQIFFADFREDQNSLMITLTRPKFTETIIITARACGTAAKLTRAREVVQV